MSRPWQRWLGFSWAGRTRKSSRPVTGGWRWKIGAAQEPFDLVITDHQMPRMNGLDLVRRLRVREFAGKIMVLSAHLSPENIQAYEELQVDMMFAKPFDCEELRLATELLTKKPSRFVGAPVA